MYNKGTTIAITSVIFSANARKSEQSLQNESDDQANIYQMNTGLAGYNIKSNDSESERSEENLTEIDTGKDGITLSFTEKNANYATNNSFGVQNNVENSNSQGQSTTRELANSDSIDTDSEEEISEDEAIEETEDTTEENEEAEEFEEEVEEEIEEESQEIEEIEEINEDIIEAQEEPAVTEPVVQDTQVSAIDTISIVTVPFTTRCDPNLGNESKMTEYILESPFIATAPTEQKNELETVSFLKEYAEDYNQYYLQESFEYYKGFDYEDIYISAKIIDQFGEFTWFDDVLSFVVPGMAAEDDVPTLYDDLEAFYCAILDHETLWDSSPQPATLADFYNVLNPPEA